MNENQVSQNIQLIPSGTFLNFICAIIKYYLKKLILHRAGLVNLHMMVFATEPGYYRA